MRLSIRFMLFATLLVFVAACELKKEEPEPTDQTPDDGPDPDKIDLPGDKIKPADLLTNEIYKHLVIEIVGTPLSGRALNNLRLFLQQRIQKTNIIIRPLKDYPTIKEDSVTLGHLKLYEQQNRKRSVVGDTVYVWIESLNARSADAVSPNFRIGEAYGKSSIAVFAKTLNDLTLPDMPSRFTLETYILQHEFCHLLGLVNGGTSMRTPHEDENHKFHCKNAQCLMYWAAGDNIVFVDLLGGNFGGDIIPVLDANCISDLQGGGGK